MRKTYGVLNYALAILMLVMPFLNNIEHSVAAQIIPSVTGTFLLVASLLTNYELGILRFFSFKENLLTGLILGGFLLLSPFIFNFYKQGFAFHVIVGSTLLISATLIRKTVFVNRLNKHRRLVGA